MTTHPPRLGHPEGSLKLSSGEATRVSIVRRALEEPIRTIVENAGLEGSPGDKVTMELSPYDLTRGRITYRFK